MPPPQGAQELQKSPGEIGLKDDNSKFRKKVVRQDVVAMVASNFMNKDLFWVHFRKRHKVWWP